MLLWFLNTVIRRGLCGVFFALRLGAKSIQLMGTWQNPAGRHRKIIKGKVNVWDLSKVNIDVETMWIKPKEISIALGGRQTGMLPVRSKMHGLKKSGPGGSTLVHKQLWKVRIMDG